MANKKAEQEYIKTNQELKISDLLKIGVKYFRADQDSVMVFNDGTKMSWNYAKGQYSEYTSWEELRFFCWKDREDGVRELYNVVDDVGFVTKYTTEEYTKHVDVDYKQPESDWRSVY
jgi:hypothetical protein